VILPFWPKPGRPARLVVLQAVRGGRGPARLLPGLVLHRADGGFTAEAEAVLRDGAALV
jgi:tRNA1(Val) A37 N6-methylase TrmN6